MSIDNHIYEFVKALYGEKCDIDAWLECNDEKECRIAIIGAIEKELEECAKIADSFYHHMRMYTTDVPNIAEAIRDRMKS